MTQKQHEFYKKSEGVHVSLEQYDYLKGIELDINAKELELESKNKEMTKCLVRFVLNIKNLIPENQIHEAMTKAGYTLSTETDAGSVFDLGKGNRIIKAKF